MENNEKSHIEFFMQNLSDNVDKLSKKIELIPTSPAPIGKHLAMINKELIRLFENDQKIVKNIQAINAKKVEPPVNNIYKTINYNFFQSDFFKKHQKKILIIGTILFFLPSIFFFYKKEVIKRKHQNYKIFYEYIYLVNLKNKNEKNLEIFETLFKQITSRDEILLKEYNELKSIYIIN